MQQYGYSINESTLEKCIRILSKIEREIERETEKDRARGREDRAVLLRDPNKLTFITFFSSKIK